jgi:hypothetical protein
MICLINSGIVVKASIEESTRVEQNTDANLIVPKDALFSGNYGEKGLLIHNGIFQMTRFFIYGQEI